MISTGIKTSWAIGDEYIAIDLHSISSEILIQETFETRKNSSKVEKYIVHSKITKIDDENYILETEYLQSKNPHIKDFDHLSGTATFHLNKNQTEGKASWKGSKITDHDGESTWVKIDSGLTKEIKRHQTSKIQREQQKLREALLKIDQVCALSGESLATALDAAHIIPSKLGGNEVIENAILLRADLHRLFDAGMFKFNEHGKVIILNKNILNYNNFPANNQINSNIANRIKKALLHSLINNET